MSQLHWMCWLLLSLGVVSCRRLRRGPLRPSWSWGYEVVVWANKRFHSRLARRDPAAERRAWNGLMVPRGPGRQNVVLRAAQLGGVPCSWIEPRTLPATGRVILNDQRGDATRKRLRGASHRAPDLRSLRGALPTDTGRERLDQPERGGVPRTSDGILAGRDPRPCAKRKRYPSGSWTTNCL